VIDETLETTPDPDSVIDDSRTMGNGPFELLIGREFKLKIWEDMVRTMRVKEMARFTCQFRVRINTHSTIGLGCCSPAFFFSIVQV